MENFIGAVIFGAFCYGLYRYVKARKEAAKQRVIAPKQPLGERNVDKDHTTNEY